MGIKEPSSLLFGNPFLTPEVSALKHDRDVLKPMFSRRTRSDSRRLKYIEKRLAFLKELDLARVEGDTMGHNELESARWDIDRNLKGGINQIAGLNLPVSNLDIRDSDFGKDLVEKAYA